MSLLVASHLRSVQNLQYQKRRGNVRDKIMTREEIKRRVELYSALADGKTIQVQNPNGGEWFDVKIGTLRSISEELNYRIKPEPKYRPFKTQEECWNEMLKHQPFGWIKDDYKYIHITSVFKDEIECTPDEDDDSNLHACIIKFTSVYNEQGYTFADGEPFGIKEE